MAEGKRTVMDRGSSVCKLTAVLLLLLCSQFLQAQEILYSYRSDNKAVFEKFSRESPDFIIRSRGIRSAIVPHHLLAGPQLCGFFRTLAQAAPETKRIVIMGPDHFLDEIPYIIMSDLPWKTPFGTVGSDKQSLNSILHKLPDAEILNSIHYKEHSVSSIIPFAAAFFPERPVTAVVIKPFIDEDRAEALGRTLASLPDDTLVILSSYFVHYKNKKETEKIDQQNGILINEQYANADPKYSGKIDSDCRRGLLALFRFNRVAGVHHCEKILYTNSQTLTGTDQPGTSYFFYVFSKP